MIPEANDQHLKLEKIRHFEKSQDGTNQREEKNESLVSWTNAENKVRQVKLSVTGFSIFPRSTFEAVGGFDEIFDFSDTGGEDLDFRIKLLLDGRLRERIIEPGLVDVLEHSDEERKKFIDLQVEDIWESQILTMKKLINKWGKENLRVSLVERLNESIL